MEGRTGGSRVIRFIKFIRFIKWNLTDLMNLRLYEPLINLSFSPVPHCH